MDFLAGEIYHIYNKAANGSGLFFNEEHYKVFIKKIKIELLPYADILAYGLMPSHYQLIIKVKDVKDAEVVSFMDADEASKVHPISRKIGSIQSSYVYWLNRQQNAKGSLFPQGAKSKLLKEHAITCFHYIHQNPVKSKLCEQPEQWEFSSFKDYMGLRKDDFLSKEIAHTALKVPKEKIKLHAQTMMVIRDGMLENVF